MHIYTHIYRKTTDLPRTMFVCVCLNCSCYYYYELSSCVVLSSCVSFLTKTTARRPRPFLLMCIMHIYIYMYIYIIIYNII